MELFTDLHDQKKMNTLELLSEVALYSYLDGSDVGKGGLKFLTGAKILTEMYRKLTEKETLLEGLRVDTTRKIAQYVQENPNHSESKQAAEIKKYIDDFAAKVALIQAS